MPRNPESSLFNPPRFKIDSGKKKTVDSVPLEKESQELVAEQVINEKILNDYTTLCATRLELVTLQENLPKIVANLKHINAGTTGRLPEESAYQAAITAVNQKVVDLDVLINQVKNNPFILLTRSKLLKDVPTVSPVQHLVNAFLSHHQELANLLRAEIGQASVQTTSHPEVLQKSYQPAEAVTIAKNLPKNFSRFGLLDVDDDMPVPQQPSAMSPRFAHLDLEEKDLSLRERQKQAIVKAIGLGWEYQPSTEKDAKKALQDHQKRLKKQDYRHAAWDKFVQQLLFIDSSKEAAATFLRHQSAEAALELFNTLIQPPEQPPAKTQNTQRRPSLGDMVASQNPDYSFAPTSTPERMVVPEPYPGPIMTVEKILAIIQESEAIIVGVRKDVQEFDLMMGVETASAEFSYNPEAAHRLGLERRDIAASPAAQVIVDGIMSGQIPLESEDDKLALVERWRREVPNVPLPAYFDYEYDDFEYLRKLAAGKITKHFGSLEKNSPRFGTPLTLLVDTWAENYPTDLSARSVVLERLGLGNGTVKNVTREQIERALWERGDTYARRPTANHFKLLKELGVPNGYEFRLIRQDEYARLAPQENYGQKNLFTHLDGYVFDDYGESYDGFYRALVGGGSSHMGGVPGVADVNRFTADNTLVVRLVLARKETPRQSGGPIYSAADTTAPYITIA